jgi:hypothetical protein
MSPAAATKAAVCLVLFGGALGMFRLLSALGADRVSATLGGAVLVFANYAYTAWLVRGAVAELAAFMLVPWLFLASFRLADGARLAGPALGVVMALLFFAHSAVFLFAAPIPAGALIASARPWRERARDVLLAVAAFAALAGPTAAGIARFKGDVGVDVLTGGVYDVFGNFQPLGYLLHDSGRSYSVEVGWRFVVPALAAAAVALRRGTRGRLVLLLALALLDVFLESRASSFVYRAVPPLRYVSFPFRLHVYLTVLAIAVLALSLARAAPRLSPLVFVAVTAGQAAWALTLESGARYPPAEIARATSPEGLSADFFWGGEYLPKGVRFPPPPPPEPFVSISGGRILSVDPAEARERNVDADVTLDVEAGPACALSFSLFANPFLVADAGPGGTVEPGRSRTIVVRPAPGRRTVRLRRQGLFAALARSIR